MAFLANEKLGTLHLELARDTDGLITAVAEQRGVALGHADLRLFWWHMAKHMSNQIAQQGGMNVGAERGHPVWPMFQQPAASPTVVWLPA